MTRHYLIAPRDNQEERAAADALASKLATDGDTVTVDPADGFDMIAVAFGWGQNDRCVALVSLYINSPWAGKMLFFNHNLEY